MRSHSATSHFDSLSLTHSSIAQRTLPVWMRGRGRCDGQSEKKKKKKEIEATSLNSFKQLKELNQYFNMFAMLLMFVCHIMVAF